MAGACLWLSLAAVLATAGCATISNDLKPVDCKHVETPKNITLSQFMGKWYLKELTYHGSYKEGSKGKDTIDFCPTIQLEPLENPGQFSLLWSLREGSIKYTFQLLDKNEPAVWVSVGHQQVPAKWEHFDHFGGSVHVLKAGPLLVLNFCAPRQIHYSLTLSPSEEGSPGDLTSAHDLMVKQGLPRINVNSYCPEVTLGTTLSSMFFWPIIVAVVIALVIIFTLFYFCL